MKPLGPIASVVRLVCLVCSIGVAVMCLASCRSAGKAVPAEVALEWPDAGPYEIEVKPVAPDGAGKPPAAPSTGKAEKSAETSPQ